jgi:hypothetical protein
LTVVGSDLAGSTFLLYRIRFFTDFIKIFTHAICEL